MSYAKYESYKDSGVDWLGKIPSDWQSKKLGILLTEFSKKNNPNLPLLSITRELGVITRDMDDQESNHNFIPDDLSGYKLLKEGQFGMNKMKAWQGSYGISKYTGIVSPAYYVFDVSNEIYPNFFNIAIRSKFYVDFFGSASDGVRIGQWDLNKTRMREIPFIFPSLEQQKKIYEFLSKKIKQIYQAISLKQQQIEKLGEYKQIVIQNAVTKGLNPNVPMKNSGVDWIGDIPEHWEIKKLKFLCNFDTGNKDTVNAIDDGVYPLFVRSQNIERIDEFTHDCEAVLTAGDGAGVGKVFHYYKGKFCFHQRVYMFNNFREISGRYFYYYFSSLFYKVALDGSAKSTVDSLRRPMIANFPIIYPETQEQLRIVEYLDKKMNSFIKSENLYQTQIDRLKEYKNILINQAVTGKIKI